MYIAQCFLETAEILNCLVVERKSHSRFSVIFLKVP